MTSLWNSWKSSCRGWHMVNITVRLELVIFFKWVSNSNEAAASRPACISYSSLSLSLLPLTHLPDVGSSSTITLGSFSSSMATINCFFWPILKPRPAFPATWVSARCNRPVCACVCLCQCVCMCLPTESSKRHQWHMHTYQSHNLLNSLKFLLISETLW